MRQCIEHVRKGDDPRVNWNSLARKLRWIAGAVPAFVVVAGDFNVVATDLDIYNPRPYQKDALLQPQSRDCYERLLAQGWTDALRAHFPNQRIYTFWDYFRQHWEKDSGWRIDHLLLNPSLRSKLVDAGVDKWVRGQPGASDHAPTWVRVEE